MRMKKISSCLAFTVLLTSLALGSSRAEDREDLSGLRDLYTDRPFSPSASPGEESRPRPSMFIVTRPDCPACLRVITELECWRVEGRRRFGRDPEIILVATGEAPDTLSRAYRKWKKDFRVLTSAESSLPAGLRFAATPGVLLLDKSGKRVERFQGYRACPSRGE